METAAKKKMGFTETVGWLGLAAMVWVMLVVGVGFLAGIVYGLLAIGFKTGMMVPWLPS
jgi:hypothetical protein